MNDDLPLSTSEKLAIGFTAFVVLLVLIILVCAVTLMVVGTVWAVRRLT